MSAERIQTELTKLVTSPHPEYLRSAWETGITAVFLPEFDRLMCTPQKNPHHCLNVGEHTLRAMQAVRPDKILRLTMLFMISASRTAPLPMKMVWIISMDMGP